MFAGKQFAIGVVAATGLTAGAAPSTSPARRTWTFLCKAQRDDFGALSVLRELDR